MLFSACVDNWMTTESTANEGPGKTLSCSQLRRPPEPDLTSLNTAESG